MLEANKTRSGVIGTPLKLLSNPFVYDFTILTLIWIILYKT